MALLIFVLKKGVKKEGQFFSGARGSLSDGVLATIDFPKSHDVLTTLFCVEKEGGSDHMRSPLHA